jgi:four helix bundle protein
MGKTHRDLAAWQQAVELCGLAYDLTSSFPREEMFGLRSQIRRAAVSVATNIAEGAVRGTHKELRHFLFIARGSLSEPDTLLTIASNGGFLTADTEARFRAKLERLSRLLQGLLNTVGKRP